MKAWYTDILQEEKKIGVITWGKSDNSTVIDDFVQIINSEEVINLFQNISGTANWLLSINYVPYGIQILYACAQHALI